MYLLATGRVAGISGILAGALGNRTARGERIAFLAGLIGAGLIAAVVASPAAATSASTPVLIVAGVLVGFGTPAMISTGVEADVGGGGRRDHGSVARPR